MLELYEVTGGEALLEATERALGYLECEMVRPCRVGEIGAACLLDDGNVELGGNGLAIVALAQHFAVTGGRSRRPVAGHQSLIDGLGRWMLAVQAEDGEFTIHKQAHPNGRISNFVSQYYPGEALLALARRPEPDPVWVDGAARGARWLIEVRDKGKLIHALNHDHWLLYALNDIHRLRPDPLYLEHASRITRAILDRQRRVYPCNPDWVGSFYTPPRSTPTATRSEGLGAAYYLLRDAGRGKEAAEILAALKRGVRFQLQTQLLPETALYLPDPARVLGWFRRSLTNYEIRIDYVQHNISALLLLRRILLEEAAAAAG